MSLAIKVPEVGESITEVTISAWLKKDGDYVEMDEVICELESDKATFELPAEAAGVLKISAEEGDTLEIGATICEIDTEASGNDSGSEESSETKDKESSDDSSSGKESASGEENTSSDVTVKDEKLEMRVPEVGESITEVTISTWLKSEGDFVELDEIIAEIDSDKATFELPAEAQGILKPAAAEGDTLKIGDLICTIQLAEGAPAKKEDASGSEDSAQKDKKSSGSYAEGHASPAAAKILEEKGIAPSEVSGTGVDGRITKEDALKATKSTSKEAAPAKEQKPDTESQAPEQQGERTESRKKMSSLRKTVSKRLVAVKNETAMLTTFNEVDMKPIMDLRKKYKESFKEKHGVGLGFMSFFTKAVCQALLEWPAVNAQIDGDEMVYHDYCDISIAVSAPKGLVVPVIRNAEKLSFEGIEKEVVRLATKARENKLTIPEMTGGTFTITNGGVFGSMMSTPIINAPQSAILGMHNIVERPVVIDGEVVVRPMMYVALSYDHRIIDGRESVSFLVRVKELLEDPARLMLGV